MRHNPKPQEMYRHFKGNLYQIRCLARNSETREMMVVYQAMYDTFEIYVRPLSTFMEEVDHVKYPEIKQKYCFELLQDMDEPADAYEAHSRQKQSGFYETHSGKQQSNLDEAQSGQQQSDLHETQIQAQTVTLQENMTEPEEQINIDPLVLEFLDANSYEQRLNILTSLRNRITDEMINTMAVAVDLEIKDGDVEDRYEELRSCLLTFEKFECNILR